MKTTPLISIQQRISILGLGLILAWVMPSPGDEVATHYTGTVVDDQGRPVAGATVECYRYPAAYGFGYRDHELVSGPTTQTDSQGTFAVAASRDTTLVVVKKPGLATAWKTWSNELEDSTDPIMLSAPSVLAGGVVDDHDQPVAGAEVWVADAMIGEEYDQNARLNRLMGPPARECFSARTGADGRFRIENFPADGLAGLAVSKAGLARHPIGKEQADRLESQAGEDLKLVLGPAGAVAGKVIVAETGQPLGGVIIKVGADNSFEFGSEYHQPVESGPNGEFLISDVQPGKYALRGSIPARLGPEWVVPEFESTMVRVVAGESSSNVLIHVSRGALADVTVVVTNTLEPLAGVAVTSGQATVFTDTNGAARLWVSPQRGWVTATKDGWRPQQNTGRILTGVTNQVRIELTPPRKITGTVHDAAGLPVAGAVVAFHPGIYPVAPKFVETTTDAAGRYELTMRENPHLYETWAGMVFETNYILVRSLERNLAAIEEFNAFPTNLNFTLQSGITLSGSVQDPEGAPVTNATVDLSMRVGNMGPSLSPHPAKVDAQGSFSFPGLPQGREYMLQGVTAKGHGTAYAFLVAKDTQTNHYEFPPFVLQRTDRELAGQVLGKDGKPLAGATVQFGGLGQLPRHSAKSDPQGHFHLKGVCAGEVIISANRDDNGGSVSAHGGDTNVVLRMGSYWRNNGQGGVNFTPTEKLTGTVRDAAGLPAAGVRVSLFPTGDISKDNQTDTNGRYEILHGPLAGSPFSFSLLARDVRRNLGVLQPMATNATNLEVTLQPGLTLVLQVQDSSGQTVTNATAMISLSAEPNQGYFGVQRQPLEIDTDGRFRLSGLPPGLGYGVTVTAPGCNSDHVFVVAADTRTNLLALRPCIIDPTNAVVAGQVLGADGQPAAGVFLSINSGAPRPRQTFTDDQGRFYFEDVSRGRVNIRAGMVNVSPASLGYTGSVEAWGGDTNVVLHLQPVPRSPASSTGGIPPVMSVTTAGTVFDPAGAPASGVYLSAMYSSMDQPVQSDAGGNYVLPWQTRWGKAVLIARDLARNLATCTEVQTTYTRLDLHLQPGLTVSGLVRNAGGRPLTNALVELIYFTGNSRIPLVPALPTNVNTRGEFTFNALPPGAGYRLKVTAAGTTPKLVLLSTNDTKTRHIQLPAVVLKAPDQVISGQVVGEDGQPAWGCAVTAVLIGESETVLAGPVTSDAEGHFVLQPVGEGPVQVRATLSPSNTDARYLYGNMLAHGGDTDVVVTLGRQINTGR